MGTVLAVLGVLAVLFVASLVATRNGELLVDAPRDRPDPELPADGPVHADDLAEVRFGMALRGYRMAEVDDLLDRLAVELRERDELIERLTGPEPTTADAEGGADADAVADAEPRGGSVRITPLPDGDEPAPHV